MEERSLGAVSMEFQCKEIPLGRGLHRCGGLLCGGVGILSYGSYHGIE